MAVKPNAIQSALMQGGFQDAKKHALYDRYTRKSVGADPIKGAVLTLFQTNTVNSAPENTNLLEVGRMGPNEEMLVEEVLLHIAPQTTQAALLKFFQEARLEIYTGPENILRFRMPLCMVTTSGGLNVPNVSDNIARNHAAVWRLSGAQRIHLRKGNPFKVQIVQGPLAPDFANGDIADLYVRLNGAYAGSRDL